MKNEYYSQLDTNKGEEVFHANHSRISCCTITTCSRSCFRELLPTPWLNNVFNIKCNSFPGIKLSCIATVRNSNKLVTGVESYLYIGN